MKTKKLEQFVRLSTKDIPTKPFDKSQEEEIQTQQFRDIKKFVDASSGDVKNLNESAVEVSEPSEGIKAELQKANEYKQLTDKNIAKMNMEFNELTVEEGRDFDDIEDRLDILKKNIDRMQKMGLQNSQELEDAQSRLALLKSDFINFANTFGGKYLSLSKEANLYKENVNEVYNDEKKYGWQTDILETLQENFQKLFDYQRFIEKNKQSFIKLTEELNRNIQKEEQKLNSVVDVIDFNLENNEIDNLLSSFGEEEQDFDDVKNINAASFVEDDLIVDKDTVSDNERYRKDWEENQEIFQKLRQKEVYDKLEKLRLELNFDLNTELAGEFDFRFEAYLQKQKIDKDLLFDYLTQFLYNENEIVDHYSSNRENVKGEKIDKIQYSLKDTEILHLLNGIYEKLVDLEESDNRRNSILLEGENVKKTDIGRLPLGPGAFEHLQEGDRNIRRPLS